MDANTGNVVGSVNSVDGRVIAVSADGTIRILAEGDPIYEGEQITTQNGAQIQILLSNGSIVPLTAQSTQMFDSAFIASVKNDDQGDPDQDVDEDDESDADRDDSQEPDEVIVAPEVIDSPVDEASSPETGDDSSDRAADVLVAPVIQRDDDSSRDSGGDSDRDDAADASSDFSSRDREYSPPPPAESRTEIVRAFVPENLIPAVVGVSDAGSVAEDSSAYARKVGKVNDPTVISGTDTGTVSEDDATVLTVSGALSIRDAVAGQNEFASASLNGSYGTLTIDANGNWQYSADNSQDDIQALGVGDSLSETITVYSVGGSSHDITVSIQGSNDGPVLDIAPLNQSASQNRVFSYQLPANTFSDLDGDTLSYSASLADGSSLPVWLSFDARTGVFSGTPGSEDVGLLSVTVSASDGLASASATFALNVGNVNDPAVISGTDTGSVTEDSATFLTAAGTLNINDPDGGESQFSAGNYRGLYGSVTLNSAGVWNYSASNSQAAIQALGSGGTLVDTITIQSVDGTNHNLVITINGTNDGAVISGTDTGSASEDDGATLTISGALNVSDTDAGQDQFASATLNGNYGDLTIDANGNWRYSADNSQGDIQALGVGETLSDTITVHSLDGTSHDITVSIQGSNDGPVLDIALLNQSASEGSAFNYQVPANAFSDLDGDNLTYSASQADGSSLPDWLSFDASTGTFSGTPGNEDVGSLSVTVSASDGRASADSTFTLSVGNVNDAAVISGTDTGSVTEDSGASLIATGTLNISDLDVGESQFNAGNYSGLYGSITLNSAGTWSYRANNSQAVIQALGTGDTLVDTITVQSVDGTNHDLTITLNGSNDDAMISGTDTGAASEDDGAMLTISGALNVSDADAGEDQFASATLNGNYGDLTIDANGNWQYSADNSQAVIQALGEGETLSDTVTVQSLDGTSHDITVSIHGSNDGPVRDIVLLNQSASQGNTFNYQVPVNSFNDLDGDVLTYSASLADGSSLPGWLSFDASTGTFSGTPGNEDVGSLFVTVTASDGLASADSTFTLNVGNVNDAAVISGTDTGSVTEDSAASLTTTGTLNVIDPDSGESQFSAGSYSGLYGSVTLHSGGVWNYSASSSQAAIQALGLGETLIDTITIQSVDGTNHNLTITINGTNDGAVISGTDTGTVSEDSGATLTISGTLTITDVDTGQDQFASASLNGNYGTLAIDANGNWLYSADNSQGDIQALAVGDTLSDTITVQSLDGTSHDITVSIEGSNDGPVLDIALLNQSASQGSAFNYQVPANSFSDLDGDTLTYSASLADGSSLPDWLMFDPITGSFFGIPGNSDVGSLSVTVHASDGLASADSTFTLNVGNANDAAVISGTDTGSVTEDDAAFLTTTGTLNISDLDVGESQFSAGSFSGLYGSVTLNSDGVWNYVARNSQAAIQSLGNGDTLVDTITIQSVDGTNHNLTITIDGTNDGAVISGTNAGTVPSLLSPVR